MGGRSSSWNSVFYFRAPISFITRKECIRPSCRASTNRPARLYGVAVKTRADRKGGTQNCPTLRKRTSRLRHGNRRRRMDGLYSCRPVANWGSMGSTDPLPRPRQPQPGHVASKRNQKCHQHVRSSGSKWRPQIARWINGGLRG